jgi:hypothetical protein
MKTRIIHTKFWEDSFVCDLNCEEKLLFLYLLTNVRVGLTGIYEIPDRYIIFDLGIKNDDPLFVKDPKNAEAKLQAMKDRLQKGDRAFFMNGYVAIKNAKKYNDYSRGNENQIKAYYHEIEMIPQEVKTFLKTKGFDFTQYEFVRGVVK